MACSDLEIIRSSGKHILALINDILDLAKIEAGKMEIAVDRARLSELIDDSLAVCRRLVNQNGNTLTVEQTSTVAYIDTDVTKLRHTTINLLSNAGKFTTNGEVTLTTRSFAHDSTDWIEISVRDTGIGIAPEFHAAVFEDFHRGDSNTARTHGGTGLGTGAEPAPDPPAGRRYHAAVDGGARLGLHHQPARPGDAGSDHSRGGLMPWPNC